MRKILGGKVYDTETAEALLFHKWRTYHPNMGGRNPTLDHKRGVYRTKKGALFGYAFDEIGYGRDRNGVTGAYVRTESALTPFDDVGEAVAWCESEDVFDAEDIMEHLGEGVEEA